MKTLCTILLLALMTSIPMFGAGPEPSDDWLMSYYLNPTPDQLPGHLKDMAANGVLSDPKAQAPLVGFSSQVMADNPAEIDGWMNDLQGLPEDAMAPVLTALWFSNTDEGRQYFEENGLSEYLEGPAPDILEMAIDNPGTLDLLWGYFFATGEKAPIRSLVAALSLGQYAGALKAYPDSEKTDADRQAAYLDATFQSALWSLESNAVAHPIVHEYCEEIITEDDLTEREKLWLGVVLSKVNRRLSPAPAIPEPKGTNDADESAPSSDPETSAPPSE